MFYMMFIYLLFVLDNNMVQIISRKRHNGVRLQLYREKIDERLLAKFHQFFPRDGHQLYQEFKKQEAVLKRQRGAKVLSRTQYTTLLPKTGFVDSTQFDTTLLIFLFRTFCLPKPARGWGVDPDDTDWSVEANTERFLKARNWIQHSKVKVSNSKFKEITDFLHKPLLCYGCTEEELKALKTCVLDSRLGPILRNELKSIPFRHDVFEPISNHLIRDNLITKIHKQLSCYTDGADVTVRKQNNKRGLAISGLGGVGKSELCRKFCQIHEEDYNAILWINGESKTSIGQSFQNIHEIIFAPDINGSHQVAVQAVYQFFRKSSVLVVFDGVDDYNSITNFLPPSLPTSHSSTNTHQLTHHHVLVTSQNKNVPVGFSTISLSVFEKEQAFEFLRTNISEDCQHDTEGLASIVDFLECHPLALQQAVAYIKENVVSLGDYLHLLQTNAPDLLNHPIIDAGQHSVMKTFTLAINKLKNCPENLGEASAVLKVLDFFSFLDGKNIKRGLVCDFLGKSVVETNKVLHILKNYSIINIQGNRSEYEEQVITINSLVQIAVREEQIQRQKLKQQQPQQPQQQQQQQQQPKEIAICAIFKYNTGDAIFHELKHLCNHIMYMFHQQETISRLLEYVAYNQTFILEIFKLRAMYEELQYIFEGAKQHLLTIYLEEENGIDEDSTKKESRRIIEDLIININHNLSLILSQRGQHHAAFQLIKLVRRCLQNIPEWPPAEKKNCIQNLATNVDTLTTTGNSEVDHKRKLLVTESNMASCLLDQKKFKEALVLFQQIYTEEKKLYGEGHPDLLKTYSNIAFCMMNTKKYSKALKMFRYIEQQKKDIYTRENEPAILPTQINIASCLVKKQHYGKALQLLREIEASQSIIYDESEHPNLHNTRNGILQCETKMEILKEKTITCIIM